MVCPLFGQSILIGPSFAIIGGYPELCLIYALADFGKQDPVPLASDPAILLDTSKIFLTKPPVISKYRDQRADTVQSGRLQQAPLSKYDGNLAHQFRRPFKRKPIEFIFLIPHGSKHEEANGDTSHGE